jgi:hypothetical protein
MHELRIPFEMDTSMLGRIAALLIRDLGRSRVIFLSLARGQELFVSILYLLGAFGFRRSSKTIFNSVSGV